MALSRRDFLLGSAAISATGLSGCVSSFGSPASYASQILKPQSQNTVFHWLDVAMQQTRDQRVAPPRAAYNFAMPMVAGFLAAKFQQPFLFERRDFKSRFESNEAKSLGVEWGRKVGLQIVKMRTNDGSENSEVNFYLGRYARRDDALKWTPTGPYYSERPGPAFDSFSRPLYPGQGKIKPWTMTSGGQFLPAKFYDPQSPEFAEEFDLVRSVGGADSTLRTSDESELAVFWEDGPWGITPPGHFLYIAMQVMQDRGFSFIELARAFALLGMTQCDASISSWDAKYTYDVIRPETAIRHRAPKFGNPDTRVAAQKNWRSLIPTPDFPSYTSGHSTFGAAAAMMITNFIGTDAVTFEHESPDQVLWPQLKGIKRRWTSLSSAAEENGLSRIYGGVHWLADHKAGMMAGQQIAMHASKNFFQKKV